MNRPRILVVTKNVPWPANSGEKQRTSGVVRALSRIGDVTVAGFAGPHDDADAGTSEGISVRSVPQPAHIRPLRLLADTARTRSITAGRWWDRELARIVDHEIRAGVDVVVVEHVQLAGYLPRALPPSTLTVLDMHNIESLLTRRLARTTRSWKRIPIAAEAVALARLERRESLRFDVLTLVSQTDRVALQDVVEHPQVLVLPNAVSVDVTPLPAAPTPTACFVGLLSWAPNAEAAVAFTEQVWPAVRAAVPGARLLLVGREPTAEVRALAADDVVVTGTVDQVAPWYGESRVALAPLLAGGGSRLKIMEALAFARPVLATPVGAEGLEDLVGRGVVLAEKPDEMAATLISLLDDPARCTELGVRGAAAVRDDHSWAAATAPLLRLLAELTHA